MAERRIGQTATLNGRQVVWSGNHGWQSPASHNKLKNEGAFRLGAQELNRLGNTFNNSQVGRTLNSGLNAARRATDKIPGIQQVDRLGRGVERIADKTPQGIAARGSGIVNQQVSQRTNVDPRITAAATAAAGAAVRGATARPSTGSTARPTTQPAPRASAPAPNRSVGAAARPAPTAPTTRQLPVVNRPGTVRARANTPAAQPAAQPTAPPSTPGKPLGGQTQTARLRTSNPKGTVKAPVRATSGKTQETKARTANLLGIQRGAKKFTPASRARAVQRANTRNKGGVTYSSRTNNAIGVSGSKGSSSHRDGTTGHNIAFGHSPQKQRIRGINDSYASRKEIQDRPKSKIKERLRKAGLKDMMGRMLDVDQFDTVTAQPTTKSRGILYNRASNGALGVRRGNANVESVRVGPNMWINTADGGKRVKFDPKDLREPLNKLTKTKATRVGRAAGGTSKKAALITGAPKNVIRDTVADRRDTKARVRQGQARREAEAKAKQEKLAALHARLRDNARASNRANGINPRPGTDVRSRQGVVKTKTRSKVSNDQRQRVRRATEDANVNANMSRPRTAAEERAVQRFLSQDADTRDRGGRRTWNGTKETLRIKRKR